ncbi:MAG TPA: VCBS repeat-containing protein [Luteitalea sp.]|nr:VCBS repeat-containing protein [Luteitalea sp.]
MTSHAGHPRAAHRLLVSAALALWTSAVYLTGSTGVTVTTRAAAAQPAPAATEDEARQRCGTACHRFPPPDVLPRAAWRDELVRMQLLMDGVPEPAGMPGAATAMIPLPPDMLRIQRFYESRAPEALPAHTPWPAVDQARLSFTRRPLAAAAPLRVSHPAIANVRLLDLDDDGRVEVVASDMRAGLLLAGPPTAPDGLRPIAEVPHPSHIEQVDLDRDGLKDLLVGDLGSFQPADHKSGAIVWLRRGKDGTYTRTVLVEKLGRVADVRAADFDGDGDLDLVAAVFGWRRSGSLVLFENRTTDWKAPSFIASELDARHGAIHVPIADLNADGRPDIVALFAQEHETVVAFINTGKGMFKTETVFTAPHPNWGSSGIELVDLDKDGDLDVLHTHGDTFDDFVLKPYHGITWLENTGTFPYTEHGVATLPGAHRALAADLDGDGDLDIAACALVAGGGGAQEATLPAVVWLEQTTPGTWARHTIKAGTPAHATLDIGDVDRDGRPDLVVGSFAFGPAMDSVVDVWGNGQHGKR